LFGDGNSSALQSPSFVYSSPGLYTVALTATNDAGSNTTTKTNYINVTAAVVAPDSGGTDSSDGTAGQVSTNLAELSITGFTPSDPSQSVPDSTGMVYTYIDLSLEQYQANSNPEMLFDIPVSWFNEHNVEPENIVIMEFVNNQWQAIQTTLVSKTPDRAYYKVETPKVTLIAIVAVPTQVSQTTGQASQTSPMGFEGMSYNADGTDTLVLNLDLAQNTGAEVTVFSDRVEVYQHNSPGVLITFWGDSFAKIGQNITGKVTKAEFVTDPLVANLSIGKVAGSVNAILSSLTQKGAVKTTIQGNVSQETAEQFQKITQENNLQMQSIAYTLDVRKANIPQTGAANVTLSVPPSWVDRYGGKDAVRIIRVSEETDTTEILETFYTGIDPNGNMVFRGDSPNGSSLFGLVTAKATALEQEQNPDSPIIPVSRPAMSTNIGMVSWMLTIFNDNPISIILLIGVISGAVYFGWWKRRL
jgi:PGF-pre-PGF domain-containing protein